MEFPTLDDIPVCSPTTRYERFFRLSLDSNRLYLGAPKKQFWRIPCESLLTWAETVGKDYESVVWRNPHDRSGFPRQKCNRDASEITARKQPSNAFGNAAEKAVEAREQLIGHTLFSLVSLNSFGRR